MKHLLTAAALILAPGAPALADPMEDALYIVDQTVTREQYETALVGVGDLMVGNLQNEFSKEGNTVSDDAARVMAILMSEAMVDGMVEQMREPLAQAYVDNMSEQGLSDFRAFLETESGQEYARTSNDIIQESMKIGQQLAGGIAYPAIQAMQADIRNEEWPEGTLKSTQRELRSLFGYPDVSDMPEE